MERVLHRQHTTAPVVETGELERVLVGLGATVDKKEAVVLVAAYLSEAISQLLLQTVDDTVGIEAYLLHLVVGRLDIMRMTMTDADDSMTSVEVEILLSFIVPYAGTFAPYDIDVE